MDRYAVVEDWSSGEALQERLNNLARLGYVIVQTIQGYNGVSMMTGETMEKCPAIIMERAIIPAEAIAPSLDDFAILTPKGKQALEQAAANANPF
jgi:hypothetical protein